MPRMLYDTLLHEMFVLEFLEMVFFGKLTNNLGAKAQSLSVVSCEIKRGWWNNRHLAKKSRVFTEKCISVFFFSWLQRPKKFDFPQASWHPMCMPPWERHREHHKWLHNLQDLCPRVLQCRGGDHQWLVPLDTQWHCPAEGLWDNHLLWQSTSLRCTLRSMESQW